jgi:hypothetical protein
LGSRMVMGVRIKHTPIVVRVDLRPCAG